MSRSFGSLVLALLVVTAVGPVASGVAAQERTAAQPTLDRGGVAHQELFGAGQQAPNRRTAAIETELTLIVRDDTISFRTPLLLTGQLTAENGTALANRSIEITVGDEQLTTRTDESGEFTVSYRPVTLRTGPSTVTVSYEPDGPSPYLGTESQADIEVEQTAANVTISSATESAGFNEGVVVSGQVTVEGAAVPDVPVVLSIDGEQFGRSNTSADGSFRLAGRLPAEVPAGNRSLRVTVPLDDRAIAESSGSHPILVTTTDTELTVDAAPTGSSVRVTGALRTTDGDVVLGQEIEIRRDGAVVTTATTGRGGKYTATVPGESGGSYRLSASYAQPTTNLGNASATTTVTLPVTETDEPMPGASGAALLGGGVLLLALLIGGVVWWRRESDEQESEEVLWTRDDSEEASEPTADDGADEEPEPAAVDDPLVAARTALDDDAAATAIELAYTAVRQQLRSQGHGSEAETHWEFYRACADADLEHVDTLATLTELYEQAAFGPSGVERADAEAALEAADDLT